MTARIDHTTTSGTFSLDGGTWDVENNVWVVGDDEQCVVIDAPHDAAPIAELIGERTLLAVLCTHAHDDHVTVAPELADRFAAPVYLHPDDVELWRMTYPEGEFFPLADGQTFPVAGIELEVVHTPGHAPGAVCFRAADLDAVFTGDTLFQGGPGATGRSYSDFDTIVASIRSRLLTLPPATVVHTGHGPDTTIGDEAAGADGWTKPE
ncbi:hydroxyacylglutathione hydrolase [Jatrophihabitans endophyticus]|uniref:Hydroxyacylglutathione hydrolase n=1 Tax=Jatrophihabitans endophyticus TaxID=1206085 RepID=A0A1M5D5C6_9ACTN|nr:MBL fold metallo-hydrolase [Jatrophihabitans endophyticus]SHF62283.1 hydroxyacylglutathione hydrolase [Jatrophihabitans endophyticus]